MNWEPLALLARAVLYEGQVLYPYRPSALKNQHRWTFGTLYPPAFAEEPCSFRLETLIEAAHRPGVALEVCFLHQGTERCIAIPAEGGHVEPHAGAALAGAAPALLAGGGPPRGMTATPPRRTRWEPGSQPFAPSLPAGQTARPPRMVRDELRLQTSASLNELRPGLWRLGVEVANTSRLDTALAPDRDAALALAFESCHLRCGLEDAGANEGFVSSQDPPAALAEAAAACRCQGVYPALAGPPGQRRYLLAAPIIVEDYARIAPQSLGDFCDATEMDEMLLLRVLTLSDAEKAEARAAGGEAARILARCGHPDSLTGLHGVVRLTPPASLRLAGVELRVGDRVRLHPRSRRDMFDQVLDGRAARIQAIEQDLEGNVQVAVIADDDPGADLGELRQTGHRFFYTTEEIEPLGAAGGMA
ncbi:MAG TPA: hypothetical protein VN515_02275 [Terriglobales bacterium]|nr:hypothetical protein [Terriglobales bacterium]